MQAFKILITDLDGTLLDDKGVISEANKRAIATLIDKQVKVVISSGRSHMSLQKFYAQLDLYNAGAYGICYNGMMIYEMNPYKVLKKQYMNHLLAQEIVAVCRAFDVDVLVYSDDTLYITKMTDRTAEYCESSGLKAEIVEDFGHVAHIIKVLLKGEHEALKKVEEATRQFNDRCNAFFSSKTLYEFIDIQQNKGVAMLQLLDILGIKREEAIAVGDNYNDMSMIEYAGVGIATANAEEAVKATANYVTKRDNNQSPFEEIVEQFFTEI